MRLSVRILFLFLPFRLLLRPIVGMRNPAEYVRKLVPLTQAIAPPASFMPKLHGQRKGTLGDDSSAESAAEIGDGGFDGDEVDLLPPTQKASEPPATGISGAMSTSGTSDKEEFDESDVGPSIRHARSSQSVSTRLQRTAIDSDDEDAELPKLPSSRKRRRFSVTSLDDSDDAPILPPYSARKLSRPVLMELDDSDEDVLSPSKKRKIFHRSSPTASTNNASSGRLKRVGAAASSPVKKAHKGHRSEKQKKIELLRRRRAGERIDRLTSSESSSGEEEKRGLYDSDSEGHFEALKEFDDEEQEEEVEEEPVPRKNKRKPKQEKSLGKGEGEGEDEKKGEGESEGEMDDFITDDEDAPLGAPVDIPLEFTSNAHKPLKDQFPYVIEWLVHNRIDPAFERKDPVYVNAWRKLDDEVSGLANSKFTSSAWKLDFSRALKARPGLESFSLGHSGLDLLGTCEACGRSGHPSTFKIVFSGSAYHKDTLAEVESDSSSEDDDEDENENGNDDAASVDAQGMRLPPTTKEWHVGAVCASNAETAHSLFHWKHALKQWVEERLEDEGWMTGDKLREREKMKAKKRRTLANQIVDGWQERRVVAALYGDFKNTLENARNQATTGRVRGRFR